MEASMTRAPRILFMFLFSFVAGGLFAQQPQTMQMASLRPSQELGLRRVSPTAERPDGPVLYQLVFNPGTPGAIARFDTNPRHLVSSDITDNGGIVAIGSSGLMMNAGTGIVTFVNGQTFPGTAGGTVTGISNTDNFLSITSPATTPVINLNTANTDARYVLKAGDAMAGPLVLPPSGLTVGGTELAVAGGNVSMAGNVTVGGRISLGIYVISYLPTSVPYDAPCVDANDIAISGGAWAFPPVSLRESRPTGETPTGQKGPAPNAWRVTCTNATGDVKCAQAYVVCLSHASQ
jgi:hypothetical protein